MQRLLRLTTFHQSPTPSRGSFHAMLRSESPPLGRSTLMTSAPKSARYRAQLGPASTVDRSSTRRPASAAPSAIGSEQPLGHRETSITKQRSSRRPSAYVS